MGLFDFLKPKKKRIDDETFNSEQYRREILAFAKNIYFEQKLQYENVEVALQKQGLDGPQTAQVIESLKRLNEHAVTDFNQVLDSGEIVDIKITPNPEHVKGNVEPDQVDKYIGYGAFQMERGDLENALELFDKALELDEHATLAYANKGSLYVQKGDKAQALDYFNKALAIEPNHVGVLENKMDLLYDMMTEENEGEFINTVEKILENDPEHPNALIYIIQFNLKNGKVQAALSSVKKLFANYHSEHMAIQLLLATFSMLPEAESIKEFDHYHQTLMPDAQYQLGYCKGLHLQSLNKFEEAIAVFDSLNKLQPFSWSYYQMAIIKNLQSETEECLALLEQTFNLEPELKEDARQFPHLQNLWNDPRFIAITR